MDNCDSVTIPLTRAPRQGQGEVARVPHTKAAPKWSYFHRIGSELVLHLFKL